MQLQIALALVETERNSASEYKARASPANPLAEPQRCIFQFAIEQLSQKFKEGKNLKAQIPVNCFLLLPRHRTS